MADQEDSKLTREDSKKDKKEAVATKPEKPEYIPTSSVVNAVQDLIDLAYNTLIDNNKVISNPTALENQLKDQFTALTKLSTDDQLSTKLCKLYKQEKWKAKRKDISDLLEQVLEEIKPFGKQFSKYKIDIEVVEANKGEKPTSTFIQVRVPCRRVEEVKLALQREFKINDVKVFKDEEPINSKELFSGNSVQIKPKVSLANKLQNQIKQALQSSVVTGKSGGSSSEAQSSDGITSSPAVNNLIETLKQNLPWVLVATVSAGVALYSGYQVHRVGLASKFFAAVQTPNGQRITGLVLGTLGLGVSGYKLITAQNNNSNN